MDLPPSHAPLLNDPTTQFIRRLRAREPAAWFELWETFGPILRAQFSRWGHGRIGRETAKDLSQETLAALASAIDRHDASRGARFSTWLFAIARYTLGDEIDRRLAEKRGGGTQPLSLEGCDGEDEGPTPDGAYERAIFDAKVEAALRSLERDSDLLDFSIFRMRVLDGRSGREVASSLGVSEPTVSRRLTTVRERLRRTLGQAVAKYSFTREELEELERNGIELNPNKASESAFDEAIAEIYHRICLRRELDATAG